MHHFCLIGQLKTSKVYIYTHITIDTRINIYIVFIIFRYMKNNVLCMLYTHMYYKNQELQEALEDNEL